MDELVTPKDFMTALLVCSTALFAVAPIILGFIGLSRNRDEHVLARNLVFGVLLVSFVMGLFTIAFAIKWFNSPDAHDQLSTVVSFVIQITSFSFGTVTYWFSLIGKRTTKGESRMTEQQGQYHKVTNLTNKAQQEGLLTQRLLIFLATSSILFLAFVNLSSENYPYLHKALPIVGLLATMIGGGHFWHKKDDLNRLDPPKRGLREYIRGRWIGLYLSVLFSGIWGLSAWEAWSG